jgi:hypothetical protein
MSRFRRGVAKDTNLRKTATSKFSQRWRGAAGNPIDADGLEVNAAKLRQQQQRETAPRQRSNNAPEKLSAEDQADIGVDPSTLGNLQQKQWRAREALRNLKTTPTQTSPDWTPEYHHVLSENVRLLFNATSAPVTAVSDEDEDDDGYENGGLAGDASQNQAQAGQSKSAQGRKRQRDENAAVDANAPTAENQRPWKKSKMRSGTTQHVLEDLKTLQPQPLQYIFEGHPHEDRSDDWFIEQFRHLSLRINKFSRDYFGLHDLDEGEFHQPWAAGMTPEFIRHVEEVAEADPADGGWDKLLRNTVQREWLISAIIMRILEIQVFSADLWGADAEEKELLLSLERAFITSEGTNPFGFMTQTFRC